MIQRFLTILILTAVLCLTACAAGDGRDDPVQVTESSPSPPAGSALPPPPPEPINAQEEPMPEDPVQSILQKLKTYPIAYETPENGTIAEPFDVTLAIDATGDDSAVEGLPQEARIVEGTARLSKLVEASLSGAAFDIQLTNAKRQQLSPLRESVWRWSVTPLREGDHTLYLEIHAMIGVDETMLLDSFSDKINIEVASAAQDYDIANNLRTYISIIGGLLSIILGLFALKGHLSRQQTKSQSEDKNDS